MRVEGAVLGHDGKRDARAVAEAHVEPVFAQALTVHAAGGEGKRVVILANTRNCSAEVTVPGAAGGRLRVVDLEAGFAATPYRDAQMAGDTLVLGGFAAALVVLGK